MKLKHALYALLSVAVIAPAAHARKDVATFPIEIITAQPEYAEKVGDFKFVFGNSPGVGLGKTTTRKATNGFGKSDERACAWAALSAMIAMMEDAKSRGGSSVQGLKSMATGQPFSSATEFQCLSGASNSRVYFEGVVVK